MTSDEPGPGQVLRLRGRRRLHTVELRWCPAHKEGPGDEKADEPDAHGLGHLRSAGYTTQARENQFKNCAHRKRRRKIPWAKVRRETRRGKVRFKIWDLFANERCSQAVLDFHSIYTDEGGEY